MGVEGIVTEAPTTIEPENGPVLLVLTSKPAGAVTVMPAFRPVPETENDVLDELVPYVVVSADNEPVVDIIGKARVVPVNEKNTSEAKK